jgi:hypothetical protein
VDDVLQVGLEADPLVETYAIERFDRQLIRITRAGEMTEVSVGGTKTEHIDRAIPQAAGPIQSDQSIAIDSIHDWIGPAVRSGHGDAAGIFFFFGSRFGRCAGRPGRDGALAVRPPEQLIENRIETGSRGGSSQAIEAIEVVGVKPAGKRDFPRPFSDADRKLVARADLADEK